MNQEAIDQESTMILDEELIEKYVGSKVDDYYDKQKFVQEQQRKAAEFYERNKEKLESNKFLRDRVSGIIREANLQNQVIDQDEALKQAEQELDEVRGQQKDVLPDKYYETTFDRVSEDEFNQLQADKMREILNEKAAAIEKEKRDRWLTPEGKAQQLENEQFERETVGLSPQQFAEKFNLKTAEQLAKEYFEGSGQNDTN